MGAPTRIRAVRGSLGLSLSSIISDLVAQFHKYGENLGSLEINTKIEMRPTTNCRYNIIL